MRISILAIFAASTLLFVGSQAQSAEACVRTPAQLEANKKLAREFFRPGISVDERLALMSPNYIQHNAAFVKYAQQKKISATQAFTELQSRLRPRRPGDSAPTMAAPQGPRAPEGKPAFIVMAECDLVTVVNMAFRQDDTAPPGTYYEAFTFETFRVKDGKLDEHWDSTLLSREFQQRLGML